MKKFSSPSWRNTWDNLSYHFISCWVLKYKDDFMRSAKIADTLVDEQKLGIEQERLGVEQERVNIENRKNIENFKKKFF